MHVWWYRPPSGSVTWPQSSHPAGPKARPANCPPIPRRNPEIIAPVCGNELRSYDGMTSHSHAADRVRSEPPTGRGDRLARPERLPDRGRMSGMASDVAWWPARAPEASRERVAVVSVSYNTRELTGLLLWSLRRIVNWPGLEIVIVDNGSRDGSAELLADAEQAGFCAVLANDVNRHGDRDPYRNLPGHRVRVPAQPSVAGGSQRHRPEQATPGDLHIRSLMPRVDQVPPPLQRLGADLRGTGSGPVPISPGARCGTSAGAAWDRLPG